MAKCISPITLKKDGDSVVVPCGRCNFCLQNRRKEWSFRLQKELRVHTSAYFLTLTYHDLAVPRLVVGDDEIPVLQKQDLQKFFKRLRKRQTEVSPNKLKYYAVGEYGSNTLRPHYHAIVFGLHPELIPDIGCVWTDGFVHVGKVNLDTIDYVTKYVINKYDFKEYPVPPFSMISNGVGLDHLVQNKELYKEADIVRNGRGYKQKIPKYYRDKLERNKITDDIRKAKSAIEYDKKEQEEIERLKKLHPDPQTYIIQRIKFQHDQIAEKSKDNNKL